MAQIHHRFVDGRTLSVGKVGDGDGVPILGLGDLVVEHDVGTAGRASTKVLLAELVSLSLERSTNLEGKSSVYLPAEAFRAFAARREARFTHQLLGERDLLELHLVNSGLGGAGKGGRGDQGALHDGRAARRETERKRFNVFVWCRFRWDSMQRRRRPRMAMEREVFWKRLRCCLVDCRL